MKTKTTIFLAKKLEILVSTLNDNHNIGIENNNTVNYFKRTSNLFGKVMFDNVFYFIINRKLRYDKELLKTNLNSFQLELFKSIEKRYFNIILHKEKNDMTMEIAKSINATNLN